MARLTTKARKAMPAQDFGLPAQKAYPMPDRAHAANAKARATQMAAQGKLSAGQERQIDRKADRKLGETGNKGDRQPRDVQHPQSHAQWEALGKG